MESCGKQVERKVGVSSENFLVKRGFPKTSLTFLKSFGRYEDILRQYELFSSFFWIFWHFLVANKLMTPLITYDANIFYLQTTLNKLFDNCITLNWLVFLARPPSLPPKKKLPSRNPALLGLNMRNVPHKPAKFQKYKKGSA